MTPGTRIVIYTDLLSSDFEGPFCNVTVLGDEVTNVRRQGVPKRVRSPTVVVRNRSPTVTSRFRCEGTTTTCAKKEGKEKE